ncbi:hypothetical protein Tco_0924959 [Tanacetum coccineum]|uniref:Uncharacterized protein n=1 Tax=Tanacetum coccineum TaxID=301880 RepID=A0ABQ5D6T2_9ASTR
MTTPRPSVTPRVGVLIPFIILSDSDDEVTTLPVRHAPPSPDYVLASPDYSPDSDQDSHLQEAVSTGSVDLTDTALSLHLSDCFVNSWSIPKLPGPYLSSSTIVFVRILEIEGPLRARFTSAKQETMTLRARVESLEQHDVGVEILELRSRAEYTETRLERSHNKQTRDEVTSRAVMIEHDS